MALGNSILGQLGSAVGISSNASNNSISNAQIDMYNATMQQMTNKTQSPNRQNFRDLGGFRVFKANNGYVIQVGTHEGYMPSDAYICKEASEIGDLITAHIVSATLEK